MSKIYSHYENSIDRAWYDSSNILYSECDDIDDSLKTLRITFKNGRTYKYSDVNVNDYLLFRESSSQGSCFNRLIKGYKTERIEDKDVNLIQEELEKLKEEPLVKIEIFKTRCKISTINETNEHDFTTIEELLEIIKNSIENG